MIPQEEMLHAPLFVDPANTKGSEIVDQILKPDGPLMADLGPVFRMGPQKDRFGPVVWNFDHQHSSLFQAPPDVHTGLFKILNMFEHIICMYFIKEVVFERQLLSPCDSRESIRLPVADFPDALKIEINPHVQSMGAEPLNLYPFPRTRDPGS